MSYMSEIDIIRQEWLKENKTKEETRIEVLRTAISMLIAIDCREDARKLAHILTYERV